MADRNGRTDGAPIGPRAAWAVWIGVLLAWTYLLVVPPDWLPAWLRSQAGGSDGFSWGKAGHAAVYACLAAWTYLLPAGGRGWRLCVAALIGHAFATELVQTFVPGRTGRWMDVGIDLAGLTAGLALGGLGDRLWRDRPVGRGPERVAAANQVERHPGGEDADADPL